MIKVLQLRSRKITCQPIIYRWWFRDEVVPLLLAKLDSEISYERIIRRGGYSLLYIGSGIDGNGRLVKYHILDSGKFHSSGVQNGRLSSLRQTLCGLLGYAMSEGMEKINQFMDENCMVDWEEYPGVSKKDLNQIEKCIIQRNYLPLNWQHTRNTLTRRHRKLLTECKKMVRR